MLRGLRLFSISFGRATAATARTVPLLRAMVSANGISNSLTNERSHYDGQSRCCGLFAQSGFSWERTLAATVDEPTLNRDFRIKPVVIVLTAAVVFVASGGNVVYAAPKRKAVEEVGDEEDDENDEEEVDEEDCVDLTAAAEAADGCVGERLCGTTRTGYASGMRQVKNWLERTPSYAKHMQTAR